MLLYTIIGLEEPYRSCQPYRYTMASRPLAPLAPLHVASFHYEMGRPPSLYYHGMVPYMYPTWEPILYSYIYGIP